MRYRRVLPAGRRAQADRRHDRRGSRTAGPDAGALWSHEDERVSIHLGHRRLSIIDLSTAADQPLRKGNLTLVYNGELYNYRELRAELRSRARPSSPPPTPRWCSRPGGTGDRRRWTGSAACSRSRSPTRRPASSCSPATRSASSRSSTCERGDGIVFASELKAIARRRSAPSCGSSRARWSRPCSTTGFPSSAAPSRASASSRPAAGRGSVPAARPRCSYYWRVQDVARPRPAHGPAADLKSVIEESVTAHLVADVPVSSFLSGGLDSSIVTVLAHQQAQPASTPTRSPSGRRTRSSRRCRTTRSTPARSPGSSASTCTRSRSRRTSSTCCRGWWTSSTSRSATRRRSTPCLMCEAARERGVKVILSGMGADELFGGYRKHLACLMASRYHAAAAASRGPGPAGRQRPARCPSATAACATRAGPSGS